jgi:methylated-DNA-[protein]-cysteine S-methyltransferase
VKKIFTRRVLEVVANIPRGKIMTYKDVAEAAGKPGAYRAVGNILNKNYNPDIPCHRVVRSDGQTGGYNRGVHAKKTILQAERLPTKR